MRKSICWLAALPLALYVALAPNVALPIYTSILFRPSHGLDHQAEWTELENEYHVTRKDVTFRSADATLLHGFILKLPNAKQTFLVSEGRGGEAP